MTELALRQLLIDLDTALGDWLTTFKEYDSRNACEIDETESRINDHGGKLVYIAGLRDRIKAVTTKV